MNENEAPLRLRLPKQENVYLGRRIGLLKKLREGLFSLTSTPETPHQESEKNKEFSVQFAHGAFDDRRGFEDLVRLLTGLSGNELSDIDITESGNQFDELRTGAVLAEEFLRTFTCSVYTPQHLTITYSIGVEETVSENVRTLKPVVRELSITKKTTNEGIENTVTINTSESFVVMWLAQRLNSSQGLTELLILANSVQQLDLELMQKESKKNTGIVNSLQQAINDYGNKSKQSGKTDEDVQKDIQYQIERFQHMFPVPKKDETPQTRKQQLPTPPKETELKPEQMVRRYTEYTGSDELTAAERQVIESARQNVKTVSLYGKFYKGQKIQHTCHYGDEFEDKQPNQHLGYGGLHYGSIPNGVVPEEVTEVFQLVHLYPKIGIEETYPPRDLEYHIILLSPKVVRITVPRLGSMTKEVEEKDHGRQQPSFVLMLIFAEAEQLDELLAHARKNTNILPAFFTALFPSLAEQMNDGTYNKNSPEAIYKIKKDTSIVEVDLRSLELTDLSISDANQKFNNYKKLINEAIYKTSGVRSSTPILRF